MKKLITLFFTALGTWDLSTSHSGGSHKNHHHVASSNFCKETHFFPEIFNIGLRQYET